MVAHSFKNTENVLGFYMYEHLNICLCNFMLSPRLEEQNFTLQDCWDPFKRFYRQKVYQDSTGLSINLQFSNLQASQSYLLDAELSNSGYFLGFLCFSGGMEPVLPELFPMRLCIIWHMNNIEDGSFLVFLMWERVLFLILLQGRQLEGLQLFSLTLLIQFVQSWPIRCIKLLVEGFTSFPFFFFFLVCP